MVFAPKYRGKILTGDVAMICEGIICKTCKELGIEIIEIAVNPDHVHIFFKYLPKYSLSFIGVVSICGRLAASMEALGMAGML